MRPNETLEEYDERMARDAERDWNARTGHGRATGREIVVQGTYTQPPAQAELVHPLERTPADFKKALAVRGENRTTLVQWLRDALKPGLDYGKIHYVKKSVCNRGSACPDPCHFTKDTLFRPGAEKICGMLGVTPTYPNLTEYERAAIEGRDIKAIILRCSLTAVNGQVVGEGVGARSLSQDYGDLNKALKMAKKSAHIDATLAMAGLSEIFSHPDVPPTGGAGEPEEEDPAVVPGGRFKGQPWSAVSDIYLAGLVASAKAGARLKTLAAAEIKRREAQTEDFHDDEIPF